MTFKMSEVELESPCNEGELLAVFDIFYYSLIKFPIAIFTVFFFDIGQVMSQIFLLMVFVKIPVIINYSYLKVLSATKIYKKLKNELKE